MNSNALAPGVFVYRQATAPPTMSEGALLFPHIDSRAFGDGSHPTTRLCAGAVSLLARHAQSVLDVGTGTGILARIARARGAHFVAATDTDNEALQAAQQNSALDAHAVPIEIANAAPNFWGARFDLVVANILEAPLKMLAPQLLAALAPNGILLLSGFTPAQTPALRAAFAKLVFKNEAKLQGWSLLQFQSSPPPLVSMS